MRSELTIVAGLHVSIWFLISKIGRTHCHQPSASNARQRSHDVEKDYVPCNRTSQTTRHEGDGGREETSASTENVREPPVQRLESGAGDQVGGRQPGGSVGGVELGTDDGVGRGSDRSVKAREEDVRHDCYGPALLARAELD